MGIKCDVVRALYNPIVKAAHYRCNTRAMTKTTVHLVVSTQDCTLVVFYTEAQVKAV